ncbi:MAG: hypothetical protein PWQ77_864 [Kosmotogales bacterium]|nr:hypothetical protein [Kosmotogales bacterium]
MKNVDKKGNFVEKHKIKNNGLKSILKVIYIVMNI